MATVRFGDRNAKFIPIITKINHIYNRKLTIRWHELLCNVVLLDRISPFDSLICSLYLSQPINCRKSCSGV
ncbi:hypothetical protein ACFX2J_031811 [Malus domestica]